MRKSGFFAASVAAASASAISASSTSTTSLSSSNIQLSREEAGSNKDQQRTTSSDKFAPRFDGLRFIETLVTAHR